jgi:uncharacterized protein
MTVSQQQLWELFGRPEDRVAAKVRTEPNLWLGDFVSQTRLLLLATMQGDELTISSRGGKAQFLELEGRCITFAEAAGNRRFDSIGNVEVHPSVALLLIIPGIAEHVRISAQAAVEIARPGSPSNTSTGRRIHWSLAIKSWYYHCGRALNASGMFSPQEVQAGRQSATELRKFIRNSDEYQGQGI